MDTYSYIYGRLIYYNINFRNYFTFQYFYRYQYYHLFVLIIILWPTNKNLNYINDIFLNVIYIEPVDCNCYNTILIKVSGYYQIINITICAHVYLLLT